MAGQKQSERLLDTRAFEARIAATDPVSLEGRVQAVIGLRMQAVLPRARLGDIVTIHRQGMSPLLAEVVAFDDAHTTLLPLDDPAGVAEDDRVHVTGEPLTLPFGDALLGRVLDGLGRPLDGHPSPHAPRRPLTARSPNPMQRPRIRRPLSLGIRCLDAFTTIGEGQRVGLFSGSGVGKSTLLGQIARQSDADVFVACLVGERGRELVEFLEDALGEDGLRRGVVLCATADQPPLARMKSAYSATAIAEGFRARGRRVLLLMDSLTRFARAAREVGLAAGEPPVRRGYPASVFAALPALVERAGTDPDGSITAFYTVLVEGDDMDDPIADEVRGVLDGHVVLDRGRADRGHWPAVDVLRSLSRVMPGITDASHRGAARRVRAWLSRYEANRDLVTLGAYRRGSDPALDEALQHIDAIERFLRQDAHERHRLSDTVTALLALAR